MFMVGFTVGSIFNIIAATAAADLAKHELVRGNGKALGTMSGIMDGSGSFGAAVGTYAIGAIRRVSWNGMFTFLAIAVGFSATVIIHPCVKELKEIRHLKKEKSPKLDPLYP